MSFSRLFQFFLKKDSYMQQVHQKITNIENQLRQLKENELNEHEPIDAWQPPIIIEKIQIERLTLDKFELNNNFGQLGIKDLGGTLNIGATYGVRTPFPDGEDKLDEDTREKSDRANKQQKHPASREGPKITIKAKKDL